MIQADWLAAKDPEAMYAAVRSGLSPRRMTLLACAIVRRTWDILPEGPLRAAVDWRERHPELRLPFVEQQTWQQEILSAGQALVEYARKQQLRIVQAADPFGQFPTETSGDAPETASLELLRSASRFAASSIEEAGQAVVHATQAVLGLFSLPPRREEPSPANRADALLELREQVVAASIARASAGLNATSALKILQAAGAAAEDSGRKRAANIRYAKSLDLIAKEEESIEHKFHDLRQQKQKAERKALGRFLQELLGNPFEPRTIPAKWRTEAVERMAREIYDDRLFDRMPILADALLDADCDSEAILRHCRGTEAHTPDGPLHLRGCWVLDLILGQDLAGWDQALLQPPPEVPATEPETDDWDDDMIDNRRIQASLLAFLKTVGPLDQAEEDDPELDDPELDDPEPPRRNRRRPTPGATPAAPTGPTPPQAQAESKPDMTPPAGPKSRRKTPKK